MAVKKMLLAKRRAWGDTLENWAESLPGDRGRRLVADDWLPRRPRKARRLAEVPQHPHASTSAGSAHQRSAVEVLHEPIAERTRSLSQAVASVRAEGLDVGAELQAIAEQWRRGEITAAQMRDRVRRQYHVP